MIGLLLIYFIWKNFSELAHEFNRSRIGYFFLGLGVYYASQIVIGFLIGIILVLTGNESLVENQFVISIISVVIGFGAVTLLHKLLRKSWEKKRNLEKDTQLLDDLIS